MLYVADPQESLGWEVLDLVGEWCQMTGTAALFSLYYVGYQQVSSAKPFYDFYELTYGAANFFLSPRERGYQASTPTWALPEDNRSMLAFSDDVSAIKRALLLEEIFLYTQAAFLIVQTARAMNYM
eukprot:9073959-Pyramimonas_sp.AAC.1